MRLDDALSQQGETLAEIARTARIKDQAGFVATCGKLLTALASGVPWVGKLTEEALREAFSLSAYGRMAAEIGKLEAEEASGLQAQRIAELVAQLLIHSLVGVGEAPAEGAVPLDPRFADFGRQVGELVARRARIEVRQGTVADGATGVRVSSTTDKDIRVDQDHVVGKGTVGVDL